MQCVVCGADHEASAPCRAAPSPGSSGTLVRSSADTVPSEVISLLEGDIADPLLGMALGSFKVTALLGKGGMGTVYQAEHTVIGSRVAVKFLHPHLAAYPSLVQRFYAEARAVNLIGHENIVSVYDMSSLDSTRYYMIMELLEGRSLTALTHAPVEPELAIPILTQVCDALQAAHEHQVVHRDLKPENVFLVKRGRNENFVKVLDFGIAKLYSAGQDEATTAAGMLIGTPEYMAPEQCSGEAVDGRTDLYALGVMSYLLATGRLPFTGGGLAGLLIAHQQKPPEPPEKVHPKVPPAWSAAILKALAKAPKDRFQSAAQMREALERVLSQPRSEAPRAPAAEAPSPPVAPPPRSESRHEATFNVRVKGLRGKGDGVFRCTDLSRGGMFVCAEGPPPPVFQRLELAILSPEGELTCVGDVVRHVTPEQAKAWGMPAGFGVQFTNLAPATRTALERLVTGLPHTAEQPRAATSDDPLTQNLLAQYQKRMPGGDHYALLGLTNDEEPAQIRARGRALRRELEDAFKRPLSAGQRTQLESVQQKALEALAVLSDPLRRAEYDAHRHNFRGVARCISAGLTATDLESLRKRFLSKHPGAESKGLLQFTTGNAYEGSNAPTQALEAFEAALSQDPLNLEYQKRYWQLHKRLKGRPAPR